MLVVLILFALDFVLFVAILVFVRVTVALLVGLVGVCGMNETQTKQPVEAQLSVIEVVYSSLRRQSRTVQIATRGLRYPVEVVAETTDHPYRE